MNAENTPLQTSKLRKYEAGGQGPAWLERKVSVFTSVSIFLLYLYQTIGGDYLSDSLFDLLPFDLLPFDLLPEAYQESVMSVAEIAYDGLYAIGPYAGIAFATIMFLSGRVDEKRRKQTSSIQEKIPARGPLTVGDRNNVKIGDMEPKDTRIYVVVDVSGTAQPELQKAAA